MEGEEDMSPITPDDKDVKRVTVCCEFCGAAKDTAKLWKLRCTQPRHKYKEHPRTTHKNDVLHPWRDQTNANSLKSGFVPGKPRAPLAKQRTPNNN